MKITFADKKLEKLVNDDRKMLKEFGKLRAEKIKARLAQLRFATTLEDVRYLPGNYHELISNRKGQWACDLDQPYRLVFTPHENPSFLSLEATSPSSPGKSGYESAMRGTAWIWFFTIGGCAHSF